MWYEYFIIFVIFVVVDETISGKVGESVLPYPHPQLFMVFKHLIYV